VRCDREPEWVGPLRASTRLTPCRAAWSDDILERSVEMSKNVYMVIYFLLMIACIVGADVLFLSKHFVARLIVNIAIVAVFAVVYFVFLKEV
jgi:hypothetical protein